MKFNVRLLSLAALVSGVVSLSGIASASTITGTVWENQASFNDGVTLAAPTGAASATFSVTSLSAFSDGSNYTIAGFLGSSLVPGSLSANVGGHTLNNTIFDFRGTTQLVHGATYTVTHDDGMYLFIGNTYVGNIIANPSNNANSSQNRHNLQDQTGEVINSGLPTSAEDSSFVWTGVTGAYSFDLLYTEINGEPAVLRSTAFPTAVTPEPASFVLLGTGLLGAAGALRRRMSL